MRKKLNLILRKKCDETQLSKISAITSTDPRKEFTTWRSHILTFSCLGYSTQESEGRLVPLVTHNTVAVLMTTSLGSVGALD